MALTQGKLGPSRPKKVLILGAGMAGLCAAHELTQAGHEVTVLEARDRPGGRVLTLRESLAEGLYADAGATFVPACHEYTLHYVRQFRLPLAPLVMDPASTKYFVKGRSFWLDGGETGWPPGLTAEEQRLGTDGMFEKYLGPVLTAVGDPTADDWPPPTLRPYDDVSFADFLRQRGASPAAVDLLRLGYCDLWGDGVETVSALGLLRDLARPLETYVMPGGCDQLVRALAAELAAHIRYGHPVMAVRQEAAGVSAVTARRRERQVFSADYLICTIPLPILRQVAFLPPLARQKAAAIAGLPWTSVTRIFLQVRERFWRRGPGPVQVSTDAAVPWCLEAPGAQGQRGLLDVFVTGLPARAVAAMGEAERLQFALAEVEKFLPAIRNYFEGGVTYCWDRDEWAGGGYAWFRPGQLLGLGPALAVPEGRIHFAGDHTSPWPGWMQGAIYSGLRAAREVQAAP